MYLLMVAWFLSITGIIRISWQRRNCCLPHSQDSSLSMKMSKSQKAYVKSGEKKKEGICRELILQFL